MWPSVSHIRQELYGGYYRQNVPQPSSVSIDPSNAPAPMTPDGRISLYPQARRLFSQLGAANVFTAERNVFRDLEARRLYLTSDRGRKRNIQALDGATATRLVRGLRPCTYSLDGEPAAGMLADEAPPELARHTEGGAGPLALDYPGLLAHLWASVQDAHHRIDRVEEEKGKQTETGNVGGARAAHVLRDRGMAGRRARSLP